jgi:hypothetical protein
MTMHQLVARYGVGAKTSHELVVDCLNLLDPDDPSSSLGELPAETLPKLEEFLESYQAVGMLSLHGGAIPTPAQVASARRWLAMQDELRSQESRDFLQSGWK